MGNQNNKATDIKQKEEPSINKNTFNYLYVVGKGGFGKVWKVYHKKFNKHFALKEMAKAKIIDKKSEKSIKWERDLLTKIKHPFIVNMQYCFQDRENLYLVMDLLTGGDLRFHVSKYKRFTEEQTKFFVCCILLGLEYLHVNNILHRDIKPENLVLDERGYVRITDFGIAKYYQKENSSETSGTPGYMSPEVMCAQNHTIAVDYFALGVMTYEFMMGVRPYTGRSRKEIKEKIMAKQVQVKKHEIPEGWSTEAADFVNRLLQRKPANRLGLRGATEVKEHAWLKYFPWRDLYEKKLEAPFSPKMGDNFDSRYCNAPDKMGQDTKEKYENYIRDAHFQNVFKHFTYINEELFDEKAHKKNVAMYQSKRDVKFQNPHSNISNYNNSLSSSIYSGRDISYQNFYNSRSNSLSKDRLREKSPSLNMESRFLKLKKQSNSSSTSSLLRQYRQSNNSQNTTSTSLNYLHRKSGSTTNFNNY